MPELKDYIKAAYPCLFLRTVEPAVAEQTMVGALGSLGMSDIDYGVWKVTSGLLVGKPGTDPRDRTEKAKDLIDALGYIETAREPIVAVFHNLRQFVTNFQVIQQLVDTVHAARYMGSHVIIVGPYCEFPPELKNLITVVEIPLPTKEQIKEELEKLVMAYESDIELPKLKKDREQLLVDASTAAVGLDSMGVENAMALSLATTHHVDLRLIQAQKEQEVKKSDVLEFIKTEDGLDDVGGYDVLKDWLRRRDKVFTQEARDYGLSYPKGMLIVGPAGTGKSLTAKAVASYLKLPLLRLDMGKIFKSLVGESEASIRLALQVAEAVSPAVLWMDEIDKGLAGMRGSGDLDSGVTARVISTILTWRQETKSPVMLVATANDVASIPSMVYRKGRLDEVWATDLPSVVERAEIFKIHIRKRGRVPEDYDCDALAVQCNDFTGSEIESCIEDAMFTAFDEGVEFGDSHILAAIRDTTPQAIRDAEEIQAIRKWVETRARKVSSPAVAKKGRKTTKLRSVNVKK